MANDGRTFLFDGYQAKPQSDTETRGVQANSNARPPKPPAPKLPSHATSAVQVPKKQ